MADRVVVAVPDAVSSVPDGTGGIRSALAALEAIRARPNGQQIIDAMTVIAIRRGALILRAYLDLARK